MSVLAATALSGGYGGRDIVTGVSTVASSGRCLAVLGPNGAGKSTLLRLLAGVLPASAGSVELLGKPLAAWRRREVARVVGLVPQIVSITFPLTVGELVEQGRAPHLGPWRPFTAADRAAVERALERVDLAGRAATPLHCLSGGERQRAVLARTLASEPRVLLLDEPAAALDVAHQLDLVAVLTQLLAEGVAVVLVVHDWNLALRVAHEIVVLRHGRVHAAGSPAQILAGPVLPDVFDVEVDIVHDREGTPVVVPHRTRGRC